MFANRCHCQCSMAEPYGSSYSMDSLTRRTSFRHFDHPVFVCICEPQIIARIVCSAAGSYPPVRSGVSMTTSI